MTRTRCRSASALAAGTESGNRFLEFVGTADLAVVAEG